MDYKEIGEKEFSKSSMFGYKPNEVDDFLDEVSKEFEAITKKNSELQDKLEILALKVREYRANEEQLKTSILDAQKRANHIVKEATEKSESMLNSAKSESEKILDDAKLKSISMINDAKEQYDRIKAECEKEQSGSKIALDNLQKEVTEFKANLVELYKQHLTQVIAMPEKVEEGVLASENAENTTQLSLDDNLKENK